MPTKNKYYAYVVPSEGKEGIVDNWDACEKIVSGKIGARYRGFPARTEAAQWLADGAQYESAPRPPGPALERGIYFDAGTGRGQGVEISVTDEKGTNLLHKVLPPKKLNRFGKHLLADSATNNYGELLAFKYALMIAKKQKVKKVFGDSRLVIEYWSQWRMKRKELPAETVELAAEVAKLRETFEKQNGVVRRISGAHNPADLGYHH